MNTSNPFDVATPHMIECYEANVAHYRSGNAKPNYQLPTTIAETFIVKDTVAIYHTNRDTKVLEMIWWQV